MVSAIPLNILIVYGKDPNFNISWHVHMGYFSHGQALNHMFTQ